MEPKHEDQIKTNLEEKPHHQNDHVSSSSSSSSSSSAFSTSHDFDTQTKDNPLSLQDKNNENDLPESINPQTPNWSMLSASPPPDFLYFSPDNHLITQSPPLQNYDPNRIPMSVFSSKPTNSSEWSVASNESLFSIQMGNDYTNDMYKSGELPRLDGKSSCNNDYLPTVVEAHEEGSVKSCNNYKDDDDDDDDKLDNVKNVKVYDDDNAFGVINKPENNREMEKINSRVSSLHHPRVSDPRLSDESGNSNRSFAFPVLVNDAGKIRSLKAVPEKQQLQGHQDVASSSNSPNKASSSSSMTRWCSWFCCSCPRCC